MVLLGASFLFSHGRVLHAAEWSYSEIQFQYGTFDVPTFIEPSGAKQGTFNLLHQHSSGWSWGDVYYFVELMSATTNRHIPYQREDVYGELYVNFSSAKLLDVDYDYGPLADIGVIQGLNFGVDAKVFKYLPGVRRRRDRRSLLPRDGVHRGSDPRGPPDPDRP